MNVMKMKNNIAVKYVGGKTHKTCDLALKETEGENNYLGATSLWTP